MKHHINNLGDLTPDPRNARRHNPRNVGAIERSLREVGAGRSIVVDENGVILAGNATVEACAAAGIERVRVVEADGNELVIVQRSGLTDEQKVRLALADNRAADLAEWDETVLAEIAAEYPQATDGLWTDKEVQEMTSAPVPEDAEKDLVPEQFLILITCQNESEQLELLDRLQSEGKTCKALIS